MSKNLQVPDFRLQTSDFTGLTDSHLHCVAVLRAVLLISTSDFRLRASRKSPRMCDAVLRAAHLAQSEILLFASPSKMHSHLCSAV